MSREASRWRPAGRAQARSPQRPAERGSARVGASAAAASGRQVASVAEGNASSARPAARFVAALLLAAIAGCGRVPKIIVLQDPLTAQEHLALGVAYEQKDELELALKEYGKALGKDPKLVQARINRGNVFVRKKAFEEARGEYLGALDLSPGNAEATNNLAWAAIGSGNAGHLADAEARITAVLADPRNRTAALLDTLGVLRMGLSSPAAADEAFAEAERACGAGCPEAQRREIADHRRELRSRFPAGERGLPLVR